MKAFLWVMLLMWGLGAACSAGHCAQAHPRQSTPNSADLDVVVLLIQCAMFGWALALLSN